MRKLWIGIWILLVAACTSIPESEMLDSIPAIDRTAYQRHQQLLDSIDSWRLQGQIALFNLRDDSRDAVYIDWRWSPTATSMRFSHPLKGTLARLEQTSAGAVLIDDEQNEYRAATMTSLLQTYFGISIPVDALPGVVLGRLPQRAKNITVVRPSAKDDVVVLSSYEVIAVQEPWRAELSLFTAVDTIYVPSSIELNATDWRIKLRITDWSL